MKLPRFRFSFLTAVVAAALAANPLLARGDCSLTSTGIIPLNDLGPGRYQGFTAGLYPAGSDTPPAAHAAAALAIATDQLPFSTGEVINVDGGFHLRRL